MTIKVEAGMTRRMKLNLQCINPLRISGNHNHLVTHAAHPDPGQFGVGRDKFRPFLLDPAGSFADDLDVADNRILRLLIFLERLNSVNVLQVILDALRMLHKGSACWRTRSRNFGERNPAVKTVTGTPSSCCASCSMPASVKRVVVSAASTNRSRSLSSVSVPLRTEPKTRGWERP